MVKIFRAFVVMVALMGCNAENSYQSYETLTRFQNHSPRAEVVELRHKKSGAKVVLIQNQDAARTFMAAFKTPPYDDTGLFHIFEHAVLAGSKRYPSKSNFLNLVNSTVASFINAMTGSVSTYYPFVTKDPQDFDNLLSAYMDAVFFPKTVEDPRIVKREGWRYEMDSRSKKLSVNGVVLNEMKGVFSGPYRTLFFHLSRALLPQTPYAYESGGLPDKIMELRFEQIVEAHKKYYHPQNSVIYLYGNIDYKKTLAIMDQQFLGHFQKTPGFVSPDIAFQKNTSYPTPVVEASYQAPVAPNKDFLAKGYVLGPLNPMERDIAYVLREAFAAETASPLRLRILKEGLAQSIMAVGLEGQDNAMSFVFEGTDVSHKEKIEKVLKEEMDKVVAQGLDSELITSILNQREFYYKDKYNNGSHRGFNLGFSVVDNWIFPELSLQERLDFTGHLKEIRKLLSDKNFVVSFFKKHFVENSRTRFLVMRPDPQFLKKFHAKLEKKLAQALVAKPLTEYKKEDEDFHQWVKSKEAPEIVGKTPMLKLADIAVAEKPIAFRKFMKGNTEVITYPQDTNGIAYVKLFFDLEGVAKENLKNLEFFKNFLKKTNTTNRSFQDLSKQIGIHTGGIDFEVAHYQSFKNPEKFRPTLFVNLSFSNENGDKSFALLKDILTGSEFVPLDRLSSLVTEMKFTMANTVSQRGVELAMGASRKSFFPDIGAFKSEIGGGVFEEYILTSKLEAKELSFQLKKILKNVFNQNRLYLATMVASPKDLERLSSDLERLRNSLPQGAAKNPAWSFADQKNYDSYAIPGEVQYVAETASIGEELKYSGAMKVYANYLNANFMTPKLREQAGAYGGGAFFDGHGLFSMYSYRDPHLARSFETFSQVADFIKKEKLESKKLKPAILGSLKSYYRDRSISEKTGLMTELYLTDRTWDDYIRIKKEILSTTDKDLQKINGILAKALKKSQKSVSGNPDKLKREAPYLKRTLSLQ